MPAASTINPEERKFVVDSRASVHMVSKKDLNKAKLETVRVSKSPTTVVTANGEVLTKEEATVYVRELDSFVTVMLLENKPAVLSSDNSAKITGVITIGPVVRNHISSKMAGRWIATRRTTYLVYRHVGKSCKLVQGVNWTLPKTGQAPDTTKLASCPSTSGERCTTFCKSSYRKWGCEGHVSRINKCCNIRNLLRDHVFELINAVLEKSLRCNLCSITDVVFHFFWGENGGRTVT